MNDEKLNLILKCLSILLSDPDGNNGQVRMMLMSEINELLNSQEKTEELPVAGQGGLRQTKSSPDTIQFIKNDVVSLMEVAKECQEQDKSEQIKKEIDKDYANQQQEVKER